MVVKQTEKSRAGGFYLAGIGLAVALVGAVFVYLLWAGYMQAKSTREWEETPCLVIVSKVAERSSEHVAKEYSWEVRYMYDFAGESYEGEFHTPRRAKWNSSKKKAEVLVEEYPVNQKAVCYVNLAEPSQAILKHDSKASLYSIWFPMLFVIGGLGIMVSALRGLNLKFNPC